MKTSLKMVGAIGFGLWLTTSAVVASEDSLVTAVFSNVSNGYVREKLPDGSFKRETYAISNGGYAAGIARNQSIDSVPFPAIAGLVAEHLARQNYFLAQDSKSADLLLVISWGTTVPFDDGVSRNAQDGALAAMNKVQQLTAQGRNLAPAALQQRSADGIQSPAAAGMQAANDELEGQLFEMQMFNSMRERADERNARLLGYKREIDSRNDQSRYAGGGSYFDDLISDIETERYYVIVAAYDFRAATQEKKKKLLWATRVSIQAQGNRFNESLAAMLANASRNFGQDSHGLLRQYQRTGRVNLGEMKVLGEVPASSMPEKPAQEK